MRRRRRASRIAPRVRSCLILLCGLMPPIAAAQTAASPERRHVEGAFMSGSDQQQAIDALLALEATVMKAIAAKDRDTLRPILSDTFVLRVPGAPDVDKDQFLEGIAAVPGDVQSIRGEDTKAAVFGDLGIVTGLQIATVRLAEDGRLVASRGAFTDVFERADGRWRLALAFSIELTDDDD
jgi:ketosteroid isomerase-like protein